VFHYVIRRLLQSFWVLVGITIISFVIVHIAPGSPVGAELNPKVSAQYVKTMRTMYHLDEPLYKQYYYWIRDLITGDLVSIKDGRPVLTKIKERLPWTLLLNLVAVVIIFSVAIPLGIFSATHRYSIADHTTTFFAFLGISIPSFWLAYMLILLFVKRLGIPIIGQETFGLMPVPPPAKLADWAWHLFLPALVFAVGGIASISRYMRGSFMNAMSEDYIRTARAKGLKEVDVQYKHGLRNALMPIITLIGFLIPSLIGGSVIIETIFAWPGIGRLSYQAVLSRDYPVVMTINTIGAVLVLLGNLTADVLYAVVDPRIRYK
jgi:peptide/nickel transport system permease protein